MSPQNNLKELVQELALGGAWASSQFPLLGIGFGAILVHLSTESSLAMPVLHCKQQKWEG